MMSGMLARRIVSHRENQRQEREVFAALDAKQLGASRDLRTAALDARDANGPFQGRPIRVECALRRERLAVGSRKKLAERAGADLPYVAESQSKVEKLAHTDRREIEGLGPMGISFTTSYRTEVRVVNVVWMNAESMLAGSRNV